MSIEGLKQTKLLLIGETGDGKSSLGNFILKKNVFKVSDSDESSTKYTGGYFGEGDRNDVFVVDTPCLIDGSGFNNKNIQILLNVYCDNLKYIVKVISDGFPIKGVWKHICIVWTKCYNCYSQNQIEKDKIEKKEFKEEIIKFIKQTNRINENIDIPMCYVNSQPIEGCNNTKSEEEIKKLIKWARGLKPIDKEEISKLISEYKKIIYEEKEERETIEETILKRTYKITKYIRCKKVKNGGEVIYGESTEICSRIITENKYNKEPSDCVVM
ncbi:hypothetical protein EDI_265320 [Entamoeba dispar SAW760]|uniref:AIG1-type G domain-containing protein n=1 Tax=Entamoeba dispar (strain ATCC PRA-260 / SAW760) TaxID=370354 RepID=B0ENS3_ENTDS|nr:uncharacterized protein EDI_265320 [Entamoeba dispar SAW760]EDR23828.1 hypothetical protein EDI_265320 [Entamoeba dispar SAW760]|eukprot:EDR23828.1 hypothetical protein EDI_265320 [Entamoeba dispar SAW760]